MKQHSDDMHKRFTHIHGDMQQWLLSQLNASNSVIRDYLTSAGSSLKNSADEAGDLLVKRAATASESLMTANDHIGNDFEKLIASIQKQCTNSTESIAQLLNTGINTGKTVSDQFVEAVKVATAEHETMARQQQEAATQLIEKMETAGGSLHASGENLLNEWTNLADELGKEMISAAKECGRVTENMQTQINNGLEKICSACAAWARYLFNVTTTKDIRIRLNTSVADLVLKRCHPE